MMLQLGHTQLISFKTRCLTGSDNNPWLAPSHVFGSSLVSGLAHYYFLPYGSNFLPFPSWTISSLASSNEGPNLGTSSRDLFPTSWNLSTLSYHFLASSEASTTNYWVAFVMHYFGLNATKEFHFESSMVSTWCICRYTVWTIGQNSP